jgi:hypothetical protein
VKGDQNLPRQRDVRLDFFRGVGMFIILVAHITNNPWTLFIPARFGFSDATEMFIFCSGMASAIAFGSVFAKAGFMMGLVRVVHRIWQVYWVHVGTFLVTLVIMLLINKSGYFTRDEVGALNLYPFLKSSGANLIGLVTLTYVPNYFDILPMYVVILALMPLMILIARVHVYAAIAASFLLWFCAYNFDWNLPAELWFSNNSVRQWYFNPFAWQLIFFTGFGFMAGWIPAPPVRRSLVLLAIAVVLISVPFAWYKAVNFFELKAWRIEWRVLHDKSDFGILRYVHFLALAYVAWVAVGPNGQRLTGNKHMNAFTTMVMHVGRQSLAVFASSIVLARVLGAVLHETGSGFWSVFCINIFGFFCIYGIARLVGYVKSEPWKKRKAALESKPANDAAQMPAPALVK